jgi:hypothetical protein
MVKGVVDGRCVAIRIFAGRSRDFAGARAGWATRCRGHFPDLFISFIRRNSRHPREWRVFRQHRYLREIGTIQVPWRPPRPACGPGPRRNAPAMGVHVDEVDHARRSGRRTPGRIRVLPCWLNDGFVASGYRTTESSSLRLRRNFPDQRPVLTLLVGAVGAENWVRRAGLGKPLVG